MSCLIACMTVASGLPRYLDISHDSQNFSGSPARMQLFHHR